MTATPPPAKPGIKTTEFWFTLFVIVGGPLAIQFGDEKWAQAVGVAAAALASAGYASSRGKVKAGSTQP